MKEIGAIFVVSISEIRTVQLAAIKRRYTVLDVFICVVNVFCSEILVRDGWQ